jgi:hypothetical protein
LLIIDIRNLGLNPLYALRSTLIPHALYALRFTNLQR